MIPDTFAELLESCHNDGRRICTRCTALHTVQGLTAADGSSMRMHNGFPTSAAATRV